MIFIFFPDPGIISIFISTLVALAMTVYGPVYISDILKGSLYISALISNFLELFYAIDSTQGYRTLLHLRLFGLSLECRHCEFRLISGLQKDSQHSVESSATLDPT